MKAMLKGAVALMCLLSAVSAHAVAKPLNFCTGGEGGFYEALGTTIGKKIVEGTGGELNVVNTGGSVENAELLKEGECDIGILQADAVTTQPLPSDIKVNNAHVEAIYWIHGAKGVADFGEMEQGHNKKRYAVAIVAGSGAAVTMDSFAKTDSDYKDVRKIEFDDWYAAAEAAAQGYTMMAGVRIEIAGLLYVGRPGFISSDIIEDFNQQLTIGEINDDSFKSAKDVNGNALYEICEISDKSTSGLKTDTLMAPDTYCVRAQVVYNNEFHKSLDTKEARKVRRAVDKGINSTVKAVR